MAFRRGPPAGAVGIARDGCSRSGGACGGRSRGGSRCLESLTAGVAECVTSKGAELCFSTGTALVAAASGQKGAVAAA